MFKIILGGELKRSIDNHNHTAMKGGVTYG